MQLKNRSFQYGKYRLGDFFTFQQDNAPAHRAGDTVEFLSGNTPDFTSPLLWPPNSLDLNPVDYEVWGVLSSASTVAGFATSTTWNSVSSRSGVASTRTSLTVACSTTRVCPCKRRPLWAQTVITDCVRTARATYPYWKLLFLSSIFKNSYCSETM